MLPPLVYWRNEQGNLKPAMLKFMTTDERLTSHEIGFIAAYLNIWLNYPGWSIGPELLGTYQMLKDTFTDKVIEGDRESITEWLGLLLELGIDPT